jgi:glucose/arabinose dehydrogenase
MKSACVSMFLAGLALALTVRSHAQAGDAGAKTDRQVVGHAFRPERIPFSEEVLEQLKLPEGFRANVFARDLSHPRIMAVSDDGIVYVTEPRENRVIALIDKDNDGRADEKRVVVSGIDYVHGITLHEGRMYLSPPTRLYVAEIGQDGNVGEPRLLIDDLPDGGQHPNRTLAFGPDGLLYLSVGSSCNACDESNPEHATMLQVRLADGNGKAQRRIFAKGLRNTIGFGWHPVTREFWGMDHGSDWRGNDIPPEELNHILEGRHYGWPWCYGRQQLDELMTKDPEGMTQEELCAKSEPSTLEYQAHSSPLQMVFYDRDQFPPEYRNDAFVTMRGSWNRKPAVGYKVVRIRFDEKGQPQRFEDFFTGFLTEDGAAFLARLCGLAIASDGSLLVGDDTNGVIYRVSYEKAQ